jgi:ubiquinone/menaquinone biosynthesis C-methylase UbiE
VACANGPAPLQDSTAIQETGGQSRSPLGLGVDVVGVDIAEGMLAAAREIAAEPDLVIDYRLGDAEALPLGDGAF